ncbi:MAG: zinc finger domain-containing protein, partial [Actinomycetota bacterium]
SPFAGTAKLKFAEAQAVNEALRTCVNDGLAYERGRDDMSASADRPGSVHRRTGEECPVCGDTIRAVEYRAYQVNYCPTCQTGGKLLADNTTSKFLK